MIVGRSDYLDGVRGLAALIVVLGHCSNFGIHILPGIDLTFTAKIGVWLFFVLSAYLLGSRLLAEIDAAKEITRSFVGYGIRRVFRILPAYYVALTIFWASGVLPTDGYLPHIALIAGRDHLWTMPVEMSFYIALPFCVIFLAAVPKRWRTLAWTGALTLILALYAAGPFPRISENSLSLLHYTPFFAAGVMVAISAPIKSIRAPTIWIVICVSALVALAPRSVGQLATLLGTDLTINEALEFSVLYAPIWAWLLMLILSLPYLRSAMELWVLRSVGNISFSLYLYHYFVVRSMSSVDFIPLWLRGVVALLVSIGIAMISYFVIERPTVRFGARIAQRVESLGTGKRAGAYFFARKRDT